MKIALQRDVDLTVVTRQFRQRVGLEGRPDKTTRNSIHFGERLHVELSIVTTLFSVALCCLIIRKLGPPVLVVHASIMGHVFV